MMIIDATDLILGRFSTRAAKAALLGEDVKIINCEKAVISGKKSEVFGRFKTIKARTTPRKGPFVHRGADRIVRKTIRGMLPYKQNKGMLAYKRVLCYKGVPAEFEGKETTTYEDANMKKLPNTKFVRVGEISKLLGAKE